MSIAVLFRPTAAFARAFGAVGSAWVATGGNPDHNLVLTGAERANVMFICISRARSDELVIGS
jgi:hypothetical protein